MLVLFLIGALVVGNLVTPLSLEAAVDGSQVVISQIQIAGDSTTDEFVELYNPTAAPIDLTGYRLTRTTSTGTSGGNIDAEITGVIPGYSYYLVAHPNYNGPTTPDEMYSATSTNITANSSVSLYDAEDVLIDLVGIGEGAFAVEGVGTTVPELHGSIQRKAFATSTTASMLPGGLDALEGNGYDSDSNSTDFVVLSLSAPQNSSVREEPLDADEVISVMISPSQEVPPVDSLAQGMATVEILLDSNQLNYVVAYSNLSSPEAMAHIHGFSARGSNALPLHTLLPGAFKQGKYNYPQGEEVQILSGLTYFNIHSEFHPAGELRGQIEFVELAPTPSSSPTPTIAPSPTPIPEPIPSPMPTNEPMPTTTPIATPRPTYQLTPTPPSSDSIFAMLNLTCRRHYHFFSMFGRRIAMPYVVCQPNWR